MAQTAVHTGFALQILQFSLVRNYKRWVIKGCGFYVSLDLATLQFRTAGA